MLNRSTGEQRFCDVCGGSCRKEGSALWKKAFKCVNCGVKYYDRTEFNKEATANQDGGNRTTAEYLKRSDDGTKWTWP